MAVNVLTTKQSKGVFDITLPVFIIVCSTTGMTHLKNETVLTAWQFMQHYICFEVFTTVLDQLIFLVSAPCSRSVFRCFGRTYCAHLQGDWFLFTSNYYVSKHVNKYKFEDGAITSFRNVEKLAWYMVQRPKIIQEIDELLFSKISHFCLTFMSLSWVFSSFVSVRILLCSFLEFCTGVSRFFATCVISESARFLDCIIIIIIIILAYSPDFWTSKQRRWVHIWSFCDDLCLGKVLSAVQVSCVTAVTVGLGTSLWPARSILSLPSGSPWPLSACPPPCRLHTWRRIEFDTPKMNRTSVSKKETYFRRSLWR